MPKLDAKPELDETNSFRYNVSLAPVVTKLCMCAQCKGARNSQTNRKFKKKFKRLMNKRARKKKWDGKCYSFYSS
jgi:hypothetical protein